MSPVSDAAKALIEQHGWPGLSVCYLAQTQRATQAVAGSAPGLGRKLRTEDRMMAASTGKMITAGIAVKLAKDGCLDLDQPVRHWLADKPWWRDVPLLNGITVRKALQHRTGLRDHVHCDEFNAAVMELTQHNPDQWVTADQCINIAVKQGPASVAEQTLYSDSNYLIAGQVIETATGKKLVDLARQFLLVPAGLRTMTPNLERKISELVAGRPDPAGALAGLESIMSPEGDLLYHPATEWAGGGYSCQAEDLARLVSFLFSPSNEKKTGSKLMFDAHPIHDRLPGTLYGLGVAIEPTPVGPAIGHTGSIPGYRSSAFYFPDRGDALAFMINQDGVDAVTLGDARTFLLETARSP